MMPRDLARIGARYLSRFPFDLGFFISRKRLITKVLAIRADSHVPKTPLSDRNGNLLTIGESRGTCGKNTVPYFVPTLGKRSS
jgi:hypothetical protein